MGIDGGAMGGPHLIQMGGAPPLLPQDEASATSWNAIRTERIVADGTNFKSMSHGRSTNGEATSQTAVDESTTGRGGASLGGSDEEPRQVVNIKDAMLVDRHALTSQADVGKIVMSGPPLSTQADLGPYLPGAPPAATSLQGPPGGPYVLPHVGQRTGLQSSPDSGLFGSPPQMRMAGGVIGAAHPTHGCGDINSKGAVVASAGHRRNSQGSGHVEQGQESDDSSGYQPEVRQKSQSGVLVALPSTEHLVPPVLAACSQANSGTAASLIPHPSSEGTPLPSEEAPFTRTTHPQFGTFTTSSTHAAQGPASVYGDQGYHPDDGTWRPPIGYASVNGDQGYHLDDGTWCLAYASTGLAARGYDKVAQSESGI